MGAIRTRREPPSFRRVAVVGTERRSPYLVRVRLAGPQLEGFDPGNPAASVRLLVPRPERPLEIPEWNGNEFLEADGSRPRIRTLTPLRFDPDEPSLDVEVVLHDEGPLSEWARAVAPEDEVAVSGTGRGYDIDESARDFFVTGDESALPAISTVLPALPEDATVRVVVEVRSDDGRVPLPSHPRATVEWRVLPQGARAGDAMVDAVQEASFEDDTRVWAAGEAAAVQRIRKHLDGEVGLPRSQCVVRGYWKLGRASGGT